MDAGLKRWMLVLAMAGPAIARAYDPWPLEGVEESPARPKALPVASSMAGLTSASDTAPDGDGRTGFAAVTLAGQTAAGATVRLGDGTKFTTADSTGAWAIPDVPLTVGANVFPLSFDANDGTDPASQALTVTRLVPAADGDAVLDWNAEALDVMRRRRQFPPTATRILAIMHLAMEEALKDSSDSAAAETALCATAHRVLTRLFPTEVAELDARLALSLEPLAAPESARDLGVATADRWLAARNTDGFNAVSSYAPTNLVGRWRPTRPDFRPQLLPQWGDITPFYLGQPDRFTIPGPPALNSAKYTADYLEVSTLGEYFSSTRTVEETNTALFWADQTGTCTPPGHWDQIAAKVAIERGTSLRQNARLFADLNAALADAGIACWWAKYHFDFWRPITAVSLADTDGNSATEPEALWTPLLATPPFPEYPSGHSTFSGAAAEVLNHWFGQNVSFTDRSDKLMLQFGIPDMTRTFASFDAAAEEASRSRILGGIHYKSAGTDGLSLGHRVGAWVVARRSAASPPGDAWMMY